MIVVAILAVSPAFVNVADPVIGPVSATVTAELIAVVVSILPTTLPVNTAVVPDVSKITLLVLELITSPVISPVNPVFAVIVVPVIAAAPPMAVPIVVPLIVPPVNATVSELSVLPVATDTLSLRFVTLVTVRLPPTDTLLSVSIVVNSPVSLVVAPIEPVTSPVKFAVIVPALKSPLASLNTIVDGKLVSVAFEVTVNVPASVFTLPLIPLPAVVACST